MLRRQAVALLLGGGARALAAASNLDGLVGDPPGAALLVDVRTRRLLAASRPERAAGLLLPPGSTLKPLALEALWNARKLSEQDSLACPGALRIGAHSFACSHPPLGVPVRVRTALAYSCNCFVAHFAQRFAPGELAIHLARCGLTSRTAWFGERETTGRIEPAASVEARQLQALGEAGVLVTAAALALAYRHLALSAPMPVLEGMEAAVEYGTAQRAAIPGIRVAGKTGTARAADGTPIAWFAGFAPSRAPSTVITVMLQGRSGGADAAPVAARILQAHFAGPR